jgi:hypothetical protein
VLLESRYYRDILPLVALYSFDQYDGFGFALGFTLLCGCGFGCLLRGVFLGSLLGVD